MLTEEHVTQNDGVFLVQGRLLFRAMSTRTILSLNIWFAEHEMAARMEAIARIVTRTQPDYIALQEMTMGHFAELTRHAALQEYSFTPPAPQRYFTLLGVRGDRPVQAIRQPFAASTMGRDLLFAEVEPGLVLATSHLESLTEAAARRIQTEELAATLAGFEDVVFCGDLRRL